MSTENQEHSEQETQLENAENSTNLSSNQMLKAMPKKTPWQEALENLKRSPLVKDVKITIGKHVFGCHSCVLCAFCKRFENRAYPGTAFTLPEDKITAESFVVAYNWMINSDSNCQRGKLLDLLLAVEYLEAPKLVQSVYGALNNDGYFSNLDAFNCYTEAFTKGIPGVVDLMLERMGKTFLVLASSDEFFEMNVDLLCRLLSSDSLAVHTEVEVLYAGLFWVIVDYAERKKHLRSVLRSVRLELMPPLVQLNIGDRLNELTSKAVDLMFFLLYLAVISAQERSLQKSTGMPKHRRYIKDPLCPYLDLLENRTRELSPIMFREYVMSLDNQFDEFKARIIESPEEEMKVDKQEVEEKKAEEEISKEKEKTEEQENTEQNENAEQKVRDNEEDVEMMSEEEEQREIDDGEEENETVEVEEEEEDVDVDLLSEETEQDAIM